MTEVNIIENVVVGEYGSAIYLQLVDDDNTAVDISSYTTSKVVAIRDPFTLNTKSYTASFVTDGTDGKLSFTPAAGDIDREGTWEGQVKLEAASSVAKSVVFSIIVEKNITPST